MSNAQRLPSLLPTVTQPPPARRKGTFGGAYGVARWLPVLVGLVLGYCTVSGSWMVLVLLLLLIPMALLFTTYPFITAIAWLLVSPFFAATVGSGRYMYWMVHRALVPVGVAAAILYQLFRAKKANPLRLGPAELAMGLFAGLVPVSILLFGSSIRASLINFYDRIVVAFAMYLLVRLVAPRGKDIQRLTAVAAVLVITQSLVGLLSWIAPEVLPSQWLGLQGARTVGTLIEPGVYTSAMAFAVVLVFHAAMNREPGLIRSGLLLASALGAFCIFFSMSRASWLGGALVAVGLLLVYPRTMVRIALVGLVILGTLAGEVLFNEFAYASQRLRTMNTVETRLQLNEALIKMTLQKPLFGWGYDNERRYTWRFAGSAISVGSSVLSSHNTYLTIAAELGLVGLFLYLFPFAFWLLRSFRAFRRIPKKGLWSRSLLILLWLSLANGIIVSNFIDMRFFPFGVTLEWLTLGLVASMVSPYAGLGTVRNDGLTGRYGESAHGG